MYHIIYLSSAVTPFTREELQELLEHSRRKNFERGITGILFYRDGNFLQAIEGEEDVVKDLYFRICQDQRHHGVISLFEEEIPAREFTNWSMAFRDLESTQMPEGFNDILNTDSAKMDETEHSSKIRAFTKMFTG